MSKTHVSRFSFAVLAFLLVLLCVAGNSPASAQQHLPLTNSAVIKLVRAGFKEKTVIAIIRTRANRFNLEPDRLIDLKRNGVSENVILAMLSQNDATFEEDGWGNDPFFNGGNGAKPKNNSAAENETDIFGSSGSSSGESRSRGESAGSSGQLNTTGSATVRIIRPPSEAGGAPLRLEKTPTLNNEAIIDLVEAGFSEGTIIKRIESSPSDFDLSPAKLVELRKRRVSDAIIAAMSNAMDGSEPKSTTPGSTGEK
ncbi:MAG TPA: hypothetical protein VFH15_08840 [Pyrinomonadaceae bacterium]|nr:hypothetical protein [Pyrinomonadaceae bacterium]